MAKNKVMSEEENKRIFLRNEIKEKNKEIVKICYYMGGNYQASFVAIQKAIIGEYSLNKFNERYNGISTKKHKSIINYLSVKNLEEYLEKLQLIIDEAKNYDLSITQALSQLKNKGLLQPILNLQLEENILNKANKKAKEIENQVTKEKIENLIDEDELKSEFSKIKFQKEVEKERKLEEEFFEEQRKFEKHKEEFEKFMEETNYETDDYNDYLQQRGDYEK